MFDPEDDQTDYGVGSWPFTDPFAEVQVYYHLDRATEIEQAKPDRILVLGDLVLNGPRPARPSSPWRRIRANVICRRRCLKTSRRTWMMRK